MTKHLGQSTVSCKLCHTALAAAKVQSWGKRRMSSFVSAQWPRAPLSFFWSPSPTRISSRMSHWRPHWWLSCLLCPTGSQMQFAWCTNKILSSFSTGLEESSEFDSQPGVFPLLRGTIVKGFTEDQIDDIHCSFFVQCSNTEGHLFCQVGRAYGEVILAVLNHLPVLFAHYQSFQEDLSHNLSRHRGEADRMEVPGVSISTLIKNKCSVSIFCTHQGLHLTSIDFQMS